MCSRPLWLRYLFAVAIVPGQLVMVSLLTCWTRIVVVRQLHVVILVANPSMDAVNMNRQVASVAVPHTIVVSDVLRADKACIVLVGTRLHSNFRMFISELIGWVCLMLLLMNSSRINSSTRIQTNCANSG